jgi:hypothetical protein
LYFTHRTKRKKGEAMKRLIIVICILLFASLSYASVGVQEDSGVVYQTTDINFTGDVTVTNQGSKTSVAIDNSDAFTNEVITATGETVTAADSPRRYILTNAAETSEVTLPVAAAGLEYIFAFGGATDQSITIDPASTADTIIYLTLDAGDKLESAGAKGDSVHLVGAANTWYVVDTGSSAWSDGGE